MWTLTKKTKKAKYEATELTIQEVIEELADIALYAHHGCMRGVTKKQRNGNVWQVKIIFDFEGEEVKLIFERSDEA